jgi:biopolymer transport protein ExbB
MIQNPTTAADTPVATQTYLEMLQAGGPIVYLLLGLSVVALAFSVERFLRMRTSAVGSTRFGNRVLDAMESGGIRSAMEVCEEGDNSMSRTLMAGLRRADFSLVERDKAVEDAGMREYRILSQNLRPLMVVSVISPLLGLLGTVWGMIKAFQDLAASQGRADPELLAGGISMALTTTAVGLAVAIPAQASYYWFKSRTDKFVRNVEHYYYELNDILVHGVQAAPVPSVNTSQDDDVAAA